MTSKLLLITKSYCRF